MRIVLVDDEPIILEELKLMFEKNENIEVVGAYTNPMEVLDNLYITRPDCVFLDVEMAGFNGIELAERISSINPDIQLVFITAYNYYGAQAFEVNAIDYMLKPIRPERINKTIDKLLKSRMGKAGSYNFHCSIRCFGGFEVVAGGCPIKWSRSKSKELFAYFLQNEGRWLSKYRLCDVLWPEYGPDQALAHLQTLIWSLRKTLKESGCSQIRIEFANGSYILRAEGIDWDLSRFEKQYAAFVQSRSIEAAKEAVRWYKGKYLEGEDWIWSDIMRENYARRYKLLLKELKKL